MEILRIPSYNTEVELSVGSASTSYEYSVVDMADDSISTGTVTSSSSSKVIIPLDPEYDGEYEISIDGEKHYVDVVRPYVDPTTKGSTASEIAQYAGYEELARAIIDSIIIDGFYFKKKLIQTTGLGTDYIPLWERATKVIRLYENNVLMYDADDPTNYSTAYEISADKTSIVESTDYVVNRLESAQLIMPTAESDIIDTKYYYRGFPRTFDYTILMSVGYEKIPSDIVRAADLLVEDIACGKLDYAGRYMKSYQTDQFKIGFDTRAFEGTGNLIVDKILSKYVTSIRRPGVL